MFLDITWINSFIVNSLTGSGSGLTGGAVGAVSIAKAGRGAKIGSRAIRVLRILRLVRLVRIAKLYKASQQINVTKGKGEVKPARKRSTVTRVGKDAFKNYNRLKSDKDKKKEEDLDKKRRQSQLDPVAMKRLSQADIQDQNRVSEENNNSHSIQKLGSKQKIEENDIGNSVSKLASHANATPSKFGRGASKNIEDNKKLSKKTSKNAIQQINSLSKKENEANLSPSTNIKKMNSNGNLMGTETPSPKKANSRFENDIESPEIDIGNANKEDNGNYDKLIELEPINNEEGSETKRADEEKEKEKTEDKKEDDDEVKEEDLDIPEESKVGKKLTDLTTKRTIVLVLSLLLAIILFNPDFYLQTLTAMDFGLKLFNEFKTITDPNLKICFDIYVEQFKVI